MEIEVWDWDGIGDDLIGRTTMDIEDRWYSTNWRELEVKPVETRSLWSEQSSVSQGKLKLWMEMMSPSEAKKYPMIDIRPPEMEPYELRVVVWECKDCPIMDTTTNMNDLYITAEMVTTVKEEEVPFTFSLLIFRFIQYSLRSLFVDKEDGDMMLKQSSSL